MNATLLVLKCFGIGQKQEDRYELKNGAVSTNTFQDAFQKEEENYVLILHFGIT